MPLLVPATITEIPSLSTNAGKRYVGDFRIRWLLRSAGLVNLYRQTEGSPQFKIALIDGPVRPHASLGAARIISDSSVSGAMDSASARHATFLASILVGSGPGVLGLCPRSTLLSFPVVGDAMVHGVLKTANAVDCLTVAVFRAVRAGANVILMGLEFAATRTGELMPLARAIESAAEAGVRTILPAGNTGRLDPSPLLSCAGVVPVGMASAGGWPDARCTWGASIAQNGLMAPGVNIPGAALPDGFTVREGSSYAAAFATGAFALAFAATGRSPDLIWGALLKARSGRSQSWSSRTVPPPLDVEESLRD